MNSYFRYLDIKSPVRYTDNKLESYLKGIFRFSMRTDSKYSYRVKYIRNADHRIQLAIL